MPASRATVRAIAQGVRLLMLGCMGLACAAGGQAVGPSSMPVPARAALPENALDLVPPQPSAIATADIAKLRGSPLYGSVERWLHERACGGKDSLEMLLQRTQRVVAASFEADDRQRSGELAVLQGQYEPGDAARALGLATSTLGAHGDPPSERRAGRYLLLVSGDLCAAQLDARTLVVGHASRIEALLEVAAGRSSSWQASSTLARSLDAERWLSGHTAAVVGGLPPRAQRHMQRGLAAIGGRRLGVGVERGAAGVTLSAQQIIAEARVLYPDATTASEAAHQALPVLHRASFLLRLLGTALPLERTQVVAEASRMDVSLRLDPSELRGLLERLEWMLDASPAECGVRALADGVRDSG